MLETKQMSFRKKKHFVNILSSESFKIPINFDESRNMISDDLFDQLLIRVIEAQGRVKNISKFPRGVVYPSKQGANGNVRNSRDGQKNGNVAQPGNSGNAKRRRRRR